MVETCATSQSHSMYYFQNARIPKSQKFVFLDRLDISALQKRRHGLIYQIVVPGSIVCE